MILRVWDHKVADVLARLSPGAYMRRPAMDPVRFNRMRFRAWRRGFREADLLLGGFVDAHGAAFTTSELTAFETLLDQPDHDLFAWITGAEPAPPAFEGEMMRRLRAWRLPLKS